MTSCKSVFVLPLLALLGLYQGACSAGDPNPPIYDTGSPIKDIVTPPDRWDCSSSFSTLAPKLDNPTTQTNQTPQPFRGKAPAGSTQVIVQGGPGSATVNVGASGTFCVEAKLNPDSTTTLTFQAVDALGCPSAKTQHQVTHKSLPSPDAGITSPINLAYTKTIQGTSPDTGYLKSVVDGDSKTSASFSFWDWGSTCAHVRIDLADTYQIHKFKIRWDQWAEKKYATEYKILLSKSASTSAPDCSSAAGWTIVKDEKNGESTTKDILINPQDARWAALLLYEDGAGGLTAVYENFMLAEFEVWGQHSGATKPPPPDKCQ